MLYILLGEDDFSINQSLEVIKNDIGDQELLAANTTTFEGQQVTLSQLRAVVETLPFLAERRLVIVKGLLERFEPKSKAGRRKTSPKLNHQDECKLIVDCINKMPDSTILVIIDSVASSHNTLFRELSGKAEIKSFPWLRGAKLRQWIQQRVKIEGSSISPRAVELLAKLVGSNLWIMASEINKLALFASGRRIEEEDVKTVASSAQQVSVFTMVDAVLDSKADIAGRTLQQLLRRGTAPAYLLVVLSRQAQMIVRVKELSRQRKSRFEIQRKLGLASEYVLDKTLEQAGRYTLERLKEVYHRLLEADVAIKTGKYEDKLALDILVAELCWQGNKRSNAQA